MKKLVVITLLIIFLAISLLYFSWYSTKNRAKTEQNDNLITLHGSIRSYKLEDSSWGESMGIATEGYVLDHINETEKVQYEINDLIYFESNLDESINNLLNKCIEASGHLVINNNIEGYGKHKFIAQNISLSDYDNCAPYQGTASNNEVVKQTISGRLDRINRTYPDITYDYIIKLNEPVLDEFSPSGSPTMVSELVTSPSSNDIWKEFENLIGQVVTIEGYWTWGFAETRYFVAENIVSQN